MFRLFCSPDIKEEAVDSRAEVKSFDKSKLKHVKTKEEVTLPGAGGWLICQHDVTQGIKQALCSQTCQ